jgi:hypothetical protein
MSRDTDKNLFIVFFIPRLYQHLFSGLANFEALGNQIIKEIRIAHAFRQADKVKELSTLLNNIPIREHQLIAQYYLIWCDLRESKYDTKNLEAVIEHSQTYKAKALSSRAAFEVYKGQPDIAMYFYTEALKSFPTTSEYIHISRAIAVLKAQEGFHNSALKDLESLIPMIRYAEPLVCYDVLNSYAAELCEAERKQEARHVCKLVLSSPFTHAYPEWQETAQELREPNRSSVAIKYTPSILRNVLPMPEIQHASTRQIRYNQPARVLNLQQWKKKMGKESDDKPHKPTDQLSDREALLRIVDLASTPGLSDEALLEMVKALEQIVDKAQRSPKPDDTDGA